MPRWFVLLLFPTLAGLLHGLLSVANPFLAGTGTSFVVRFIQDDFGKLWLAGLALTKVLGMALCLGLGLTGGPLMPLAFSGLCLGIALSTSDFPLCLTVPCCICGTIGAFVPMPFSLVLLVSTILNLSNEQMGPPFVSAFVAFTMTGGTGWVRRLGEKRLGVVPLQTNNNNTNDDNNGQHGRGDRHIPAHERNESDYDILESIRSTVFGSYSDI